MEWLAAIFGIWEIFALYTVFKVSEESNRSKCWYALMLANCVALLILVLTYLGFYASTDSDY